jgi:GT2 family glycosyltransferase
MVMHIDIFMLTWNHFSQSARAISSLLEVTSYPDYTLIINDNGSDEEMQRYLRELELDRRVTLIQHKKPEVSFCQAMNECLAISNSEFIVTVQNDMIFKNNFWMMELVNCLKRNPDAGMAGSKLLYPNGTIQHAGATFSDQGDWYHLGRGESEFEFNQEMAVPGCTSAVMIVRRAAIPNGGWNEDYLHAANHNDVEMCCLMRRNGWKIIYCPSSVIVHLESLTASENLTAPVIAFNIMIFKKNCWNWLMQDMRCNPGLYMERFDLSERLTAFYQSGWHFPENWGGKSFRWMKADASIIIESVEKCAIDLSLSVISFHLARTLEIYSGDGLAARFAVSASGFINAIVHLCLGNGVNIIRFHVPEGCNRPCDITGLNNLDDRYLSVAIGNMKLVEGKFVQINFLFGFHDIENWSGTPTRWMQSEANLIVFSPEDRAANLSLQALCFYRNRTLEVFSEGMLEAKVALPTSFINVNVPMNLKMGANNVRFHVPEGCEKPSDKLELNSTDTRCLSVALQNLTVV